MVRPGIKPHPLSPTFFLCSDTPQPHSSALPETRRVLMQIPDSVPSFPGSGLEQNLADPQGLINYRPISRVASLAIRAAAYLLIA